MSSNYQLRRPDKANAKSQPRQAAIGNSKLAHPTGLIQRAKIDPRALSPRDVLQLQRAIGNRAVINLLSGAKHRSTIHANLTGGGQATLAHELAPAVQQIGNDRIQRSLSDVNTDELKKSINATIPENEATEFLIDELESCQLVLDNAEYTKKQRLKTLKALQRSLEEWKYKLTLDQQRISTHIWSRLNVEIKADIEEITESGLEADKKGLPQGQSLSPIALATAKKAQLQSLAMRIVVGNVGTYRGDEGPIPSDRFNRHGGTVPTIAPVVTDKTYAATEADVEKKGVAICSHFAQIAAKMLQGHGVRVDVVSGNLGMAGGTGHSYVLLGRAGDDVWNMDTWGDDCVLIDCWNGAIKWDSFLKNPKVIYPKGEWKDQYPVQQHESDSNRGYQAGLTGENEAVVKEKNRPASASNASLGLTDKQKAFVKKQREEDFEKSKKIATDRMAAAEKKKMEESKDDLPTEGEESDVRTASNWEEAEDMQWAYGDLMRLNGEFYEILTRWPRFATSGTNSTPKTLKDYAKKVED